MRGPRQRGGVTGSIFTCEEAPSITGAALRPWERTEAPWDLILDRFDARYASPDNADYHEREFYSRHFKGENTEAAHDYLQDLVRRAELAFPDQVNQMGEVYERSRERDSQVKRQFIAGMPPKLRNALFMKNQPHTTAEELAKWVRKKFAANKLSGVEEQLHESFNQAKATAAPHQPALQYS